MKHLVRTLLTVAPLSLMLVSCSDWSWDTHWKSDGYRLIAIDVDSQMMLISEDSGVALIGPTVFSIGSDAKYIVVKQHPNDKPISMSFDRSTTNYFIVERRAGRSIERSKGVRGPLKKDEFDRLATSLSLPAFTKTFRDLE